MFGEVKLPTDASAPLASVMAEAPCKILLGPGGTLLVAVNGSLPPGTTTCRVHGVLSDGTELVASISFRPLPGCCSSDSTAIDGPATFSRVDGGAVDGASGD
jgi:hypothetical protein